LVLLRLELRHDRKVVDALNRFKSETSAAGQLQLDLAKRQLFSHFEGVCLIPDSTARYRTFSAVLDVGFLLI
jgi:hypothetical protein